MDGCAIGLVWTRTIAGAITDGATYILAAGSRLEATTPTGLVIMDTCKELTKLSSWQED
jgi:hypothetical protein